jgi:dihydroxyacid dehydratase/phosphogluconate dehydratase
MAWLLASTVARSKDNPIGKSGMVKKEAGMKTIEISCVEAWREISNYLDEEISPEKRERMEAHFKIRGHCTGYSTAAEMS